jgi:hypothetical protein
VSALGATPGATRTNNFKGIPTHLDSGQGGVRGRGLTRTSADTNSGIYGCSRSKRVPVACPMAPVNAGNSWSLPDMPIHQLTCGRAG